MALVDLNSLVPQVMELTRARWSDMGQLRGVAVTVRTELAPDLPQVLGIESELREALINLIFNAVDAMQKEGPLTVRTRTAQFGRPEWGSTSLDDSVVLEVVDSGIGMDEGTCSPKAAPPDHVDRVLGKPPKLRELREALGAVEPTAAQEAHA